MLWRTSFASSLRSYATLKDIHLRLKAITNIGKITKSMKMIASTKLNRAQRSMEAARLFGQAALEPVSKLGVKEAADENKLDEEKSAKADPIVIACSSDRGLCGAIHSSISKLAKRHVRHHPQAAIVVLGDKAKPQIAREARRQIRLAFNQVGKAIPTMADAMAIMRVIEREEEHALDRPMTIFYNRFKSVIAYEPEALPGVLSRPQLHAAERLVAYEHSPETLDAFVQFNRLCALYWSLAEGHASEMSAKRMAMENASKNADAICNRLTIQYNRTRQAVITNELIDIIVGASAL